MQTKIIMIDNYDSFTYNLVQYLAELGAAVEVFRNDKISVEEIEKLQPDKIVISPGPGAPKDAGISKEVIKRLGGKIPILGVCLGHQCIGEVYGAEIVRAKKLMHGKSSEVIHVGTSKLYRGINRIFKAGRYHSLVINALTLPNELLITAVSMDDGEIMGVKHKKLDVEGVQFHPESIMTEEGKKILKNFLNH